MFSSNNNTRKFEIKKSYKRKLQIKSSLNVKEEFIQQTVKPSQLGKFEFVINIKMNCQNIHSNKDIIIINIFEFLVLKFENYESYR